MAANSATEATAPDYAAIYDRVITENAGYNDAHGSPGYHACLRHAERLRGLSGRALDVGCGAGYVVSLLGMPAFGFTSYGVDVSTSGIERARKLVPADRVVTMQPGTIPHQDASFSLVTCFDVLEHLDEPDILELRAEMRRVLAPQGLLFCSASLRPSASVDHNGENLHRTIRTAQWWADTFGPDEYLVRRATEDVLLWWKKPRAIDG
ncbi:MAG: class I SAM-dependent methyltransferase [Planctomycetota bacterium]